MNKTAKKPAKKTIGTRLRDPRSLTRDERARIFHLVAAGYPIRQVAKDFKLKYASIRHIVFGEWAKLHPEHFALHGSPMTLDRLRKNPLTKEAA